MIEVQHLTKSFGHQQVLKDISLGQGKGEVVSIIGPSGSGKTTLLRCINFLERADSGVETIDGVHVDFAKATTQDIRAIRGLTSMVFQSYNLFANLTALGNITEALIYAKKIPHKEARDRGFALLEKVGLSDKSRSYPKELSGGQKQRIGIARALAVNPKLLLLDEPTSSLDPELVGEVETIIEELASDGQTMLAVTHEMSLARRISSKIIFMEHGSIVETGSPERIFTNPKQERTSMFLSRYRSEG